MEFTFNKFACRLCCTKLGTIPLFNKLEDGTVAEMINSLFNMDIIYHEYLPNMICAPCKESIRDAIVMKETIQSSVMTVGTWFSAMKTKEEEAKLKNFKHNSIDVDSLELEPLSFKFTNMYSCVKCEIKTDTYKDLICHMGSHSDITLYECEYCGREFHTQKRYFQHVAIHRIRNPKKKQMCPFCGKSCGNPILLHKSRQYHLSLDAKLRKRESNLKISSVKTYGRAKKKTSPTELASHQKNHLISKKNITMFMTLSDLTKHKQFDLHEFICSFCDIGFAKKWILDRHVRLFHDSANNRVCSICCKILADEETGNRHMQAHADDRPFHCRYCDVKYKYAISLRSHIWSQHKTSHRI